ncbi:MAG: peptidase S8 [Ignavibacteriae bacterium HGW-Ignavibacteriae-1]|jgi:subtilisin family serine protease|nr:MAG: peptidase S8 [Ignavibacteriae bacterium HGW-Ignavibacteriae-1]
MNKLKIAILIALSGLIIHSCDTNLPVDSTSADMSNSDNNTYIVVVEQSDELQGAGGQNSLMNILQGNNIDESNITHTYNSLFLGFSAKLSQEEVIALNNDKRIISVELDQKIQMIDELESIDNESGKSPELQSQYTPWGIPAVGGSVNANYYTGVAWILDTGIDLMHPDLNVDLNLSRSFVNRGIDRNTAKDFNGHGTHIAGTIAAINNGYGVVGVCAGAKVIAVKVLDYRSYGYISEFIAGLDYVGANLVSGRTNVVNMSLIASASTTLDNAVKRLASKGAYVVVAAGNYGRNAAYYSPARVNATNVFTISAYDSRGYFASFSNYGNPPIAYSAPGRSIRSTYKNGSYATMSGTSMSTPHVSGILLANNGSINWNGTVRYDRDGTPDKKAHR